MKWLIVMFLVIACLAIHANPCWLKKTISNLAVDDGILIDTVVDPRYIKELADFIAIPSISSLPDHIKDMQRAAHWLVGKFERIGMTSSKVIETKGHPVVFSQWNKAKGKPTVLIYGHYDVQPADPREWDTHPFTATLRNSRLYGRGSADDKGGLLIPIWAVEEMLKEKGRLPLNIIFFYDGEEEIGSPNLKQFLQEHKQILRADFAYNVDGAQFNDSIPSIWMSLRGNIKMEFTVKTADIDTHSGIYGGKTQNAAKAAAQIIASFYDSNSTIAIRGFYDDVLPLSDEDRETVKQVPYDEAKDRKELGIITDIGEEAFSPLERTWYRPTLEVTGLWGGYTADEGFANIIPATAHIRLNCRLVANQNGKKIDSLIRKHISLHCPKGATVTFKQFEGYAAPIKFPSTETAFKHAYEALHRIYDRRPLLTAIGGSIAALTHLKEELGLYAYSFGFQQADENFHAPNEFIRLSDIEKGQRAYRLLFMNLADAKSK